MSKPGNIWRKVHGYISGRPTNFSWIVPNRVAGCGLPTTREEFDWLLEQGVQSVVTTTEDALSGSWTGRISYLHIPTVDMTAPSLKNINDAVEFMHQSVSQGKPVVVHCAAGLGRTGTVLACYMIKYHKMDAGDAIHEIRRQRPGSIQSYVQEEAIFMYQKQLS